MAVEPLWRWLREDVTYHHCHATAEDLIRRVAAFEANVNADSCVVADRLWARITSILKRRNYGSQSRRGLAPVYLQSRRFDWRGYAANAAAVLWLPSSSLAARAAARQRSRGATLMPTFCETVSNDAFSVAAGGGHYHVFEPLSVSSRARFGAPPG